MTRVVRNGLSSYWLLALAAIFSLALGLRVVAALHFDGAPTFGNDAGWYDFFGHQIAGGHGYSLPDGAATSRWPPGYPIFLGAIYKASGGSAEAARLAQAALGALTAVLAAEFGRRLYGRREGIAAGVIVAVLPVLVLYSALLLSEVLFTFLIMAAFVLAVSRSRWSIAAAGVAFGLATLVRAQGILLVLPAFGVWWSRGYFDAERRRETAVLAGVIVIAAGATLVPWTIRNATQLHTFAPVATNLGLNLWTGNNPDATGAVMNAPVADFERETAQFANPKKEVEFDKLARDAALKYVVHHPLTALGRAPEKLIATYRNDRSFSAWYEPAGVRYLDPDVRARIGRIADVSYYALMLAATAGLVMLAKARAPDLVFPLGVIVVWSLVSVIFFGDTRYHVPLLPVLALPAACGLVRMYDAVALDRGGAA